MITIIKDITNQLIQDYLDAKQQFGISVDDYIKFRNLASTESHQSSFFLQRKVCDNTNIGDISNYDVGMMESSSSTQITTTSKKQNQPIQFQPNHKKKSALDMMRSFD
ncbi:MAG: hypothetical protein K6B67_05610 [Lachnospiraceae bacterium]|nr:hypothetical protein [Lachnospiraceae bacterium]